MLFNSLEFFLFLPIVFTLYWFVFNKQFSWQNGLVLVASYFFYGWWSWKFMGLCGLGLIALSFGSISNNYIYQKFQNTQYSKICWFLQKCERGDFSEQKYKAIFIGSSQLYYGINDSILGIQYLNLGFNTPSKDMDFYVLKTFFESGGKAERVFLGVGGDKLVSYGIHPLMPYLVSPKWLLMYGQKWYSLHLWKFMIIRSQKVIESAISPVDENIIEFKRNYGWVI
jgi:hypothetical protein